MARRRARAACRAPVEPIHAQLEYVVPANAGCPPEWAFRADLASIMAGRDPFHAEASKRINVTVRRARRGFEGVATMYEDGRDLRRGG